MNKIRAFSFFLFFAFNAGLIAQAIHLEGNIFSYNSKKLALIRKAQKDLNFEGPLAGVVVKCVGKETASSFKTEINGFFSIELGKPGIYQISITKDGFSSISFVVNYRSSAKKKYYESLFLILKQEENSIIDLGTLEIEDDKLGLLEGNSKNTSSLDVFNSNISLLEKAVNINNNSKGKQFSSRSADPSKALTNSETGSDAERSNILPPSDKLKMMRSFSNENPDSLKQKIAEYRDLLNQLSPESDEYQLLNLEITRALQKVKDKEKIISLQQAQLSDSKKTILYLGLFLLFLILSLGISFYFFREKKKHSLELLAVNDKISRINSRLMSSIRFASLIQENFLRPASGLQKLFKDSFLYSRPKDILSGDFHWYVEKNNHKIVLVADCSGHGVPGAMLTVLGNRLLDEIICDKGKVIPSEILMELNTAVQETFSSGKDQLDYGIDISVVSLNSETGDMLFSGIGNGIYKVSKGKLDFFAATPKSLGPDLDLSDLEDQKIEYMKGDSFYLFSDGYADQFAGNDPNRTKFNLKRFADLILKVEQTNKLSEAPALFEKELKKWMGDNNIQVDDICILGFKI